MEFDTSPAMDGVMYYREKSEMFANVNNAIEDKGRELTPTEKIYIGEAIKYFDDLAKCQKCILADDTRKYPEAKLPGEWEEAINVILPIKNRKKDEKALAELRLRIVKTIVTKNSLETLLNHPEEFNNLAEAEDVSRICSEISKIYRKEYLKEMGENDPLKDDD